MGSPKKQRKKFSKPAHPWQKERILAEQELLKEYGLNRKYEIWKMASILRNFTQQAKNLVTVKNPQVEKERNQLLAKLHSLGLLSKDAKIEDVLSLTLKKVMERRLQTLVYRKNMAGSIRQARQFITHAHIALGERTITAPSYLVPLDDENSISFAQNSALSNASHPERPAAKAEKKGKKLKDGEASDKKEAVKEAAGEKLKNAEKEAKAENVPSTHELKKHKGKKETGKKEENKTDV